VDTILNDISNYINTINTLDSKSPSHPMFRPISLSLSLSLSLLPCVSPPPSLLQVRKYKSMMLEDLENALAEHAPAGGDMASELPPLTIDGIPVSVDKMTQVSPPAQGLTLERKMCCLL